MGGGTLIFSHTHRLVPFFWGGGGGAENLEFQYFFLFFIFFYFFFFGGGAGEGFRRMNMFGGMENLWICIWSQHKTGLVLGVISVHFMVFS